MACELFAAKYRTFTGTIIANFWAVAMCILALLAYLVQNWVHLQLIISLFGLLTLPLYWYTPTFMHTCNWHVCIDVKIKGKGTYTCRRFDVYMDRLLCHSPFCIWFIDPRVGVPVNTEFPLRPVFLLDIQPGGIPPPPGSSKFSRKFFVGVIFGTSFRHFLPIKLFFIRTFVKNVAPGAIFTLKIHQNACAAGVSPGPHWGKLQNYKSSQTP